MRVMMVAIIQMIKANRISLTLPKMRKTLTSPYLKYEIISRYRVYNMLLDTKGES
jgi:hypothetical protein